MVCFRDESVIKAKPPVLQPHHHYVFTVQGNEKGEKNNKSLEQTQIQSHSAASHITSPWSRWKRAAFFELIFKTISASDSAQAKAY